MVFGLEFAKNAQDHLRALGARDRGVILAEIHTHLSLQADLPSRKRKPLRPNSLADWELRIGDFRAYYTIQEQPPVVRVVAIGIKRHNDVWVGGERLDI